MYSVFSSSEPTSAVFPAKRNPAAWAEAIAFIDFAMELAEVQRVAGRSFVFEHPQSAISWKLLGVVEIIAKDGVECAGLV